MSTPIRFVNDAGVRGTTTLEALTEGMDAHLAHATRVGMDVCVAYLPAPHRPVHARPAMPSIEEAVRHHLQALGEGR